MKTLLLSVLLALSLTTKGQVLPPTHEVNMHLDLYRKTHEAGVLLIVIGAAGIVLSENLTHHRHDFRVAGWTLGAVGVAGVLYAPSQLDPYHTFYIFRRKL